MNKKVFGIFALLMLMIVIAGCTMPGFLDIFNNQVENIDVSLFNGYAYKQLNQQEQELYRRLAVAIEEQQQQLDDIPEDMSVADFTDIVQAVLADFPGFFWYEGEGSLINKTSFFLQQRCYELNYTYDSGERQNRQIEIDSAVDQFLGSLSSTISDYEIALAAYEYIVKNTDYNADSVDNQNICSVFINGISVCSGYAKAYQYLLQKCGIEAAYVTGIVLDSGENHAWNMINLDGEYYYVDPTFGDPLYNGEETLDGSIFYDYFCIGSDELALTHKLSDSNIWPSCIAAKYEYYHYNGIYFDNYDRKVLAALINNQAANREPVISCKFSSDSAYKRAVADLFFDSGIFDILHDIRGQYTAPVSGDTVYYSCDEQKKIIHIYPQYQ